MGNTVSGCLDVYICTIGSLKTKMERRRLVAKWCIQQGFIG
ncbi:hypothetical protein [Kingella oralis]